MLKPERRGSEHLRMTPGAKTKSGQECGRDGKGARYWQNLSKSEFQPEKERLDPEI